MRSLPTRASWHGSGWVLLDGPGHSVKGILCLCLTVPSSILEVCSDTKGQVLLKVLTGPLNRSAISVALSPASMSYMTCLWTSDMSLGSPVVANGWNLASCCGKIKHDRPKLERKIRRSLRECRKIVAPILPHQVAQGTVCCAAVVLSTMSCFAWRCSSDQKSKTVKYIRTVEVWYFCWVQEQYPVHLLCQVLWYLVQRLQHWKIAMNLLTKCMQHRKIRWQKMKVSHNGKPLLAHLPQLSQP